MSFRGQPQRDSRRRRVLYDVGESEPTEIEAEPNARADTTSHAPRVTPYGDADFLKRQPRLTDLLPRRVTTIVGIAFAGLATVALLHLLSFWSGRAAVESSIDLSPVDARLGLTRPFRLGEPGALADWLASLWLAATAGGAAVVLMVRRHRQDDYRASYRVWAWTSAVCILMSLDQTARLNDTACFALKKHAGLGAFEIVLCRAALFILVVSTVGYRLWCDMRYCRWATAMLAATFCFHLVAFAACAAEACSTSSHAGPILEACREGGRLLAHVFLFTTIITFGRFVLLETRGIIRTPTALETAKRKRNGEPVVRDSDNEKTAPIAAWPKARAKGSEGVQGAFRLDSAGANRATETDGEDSKKETDGDAASGQSSEPVSSEATSEGSAHERRTLSKAQRKAMRRNRRSSRS